MRQMQILSITVICALLFSGNPLTNRMEMDGQPIAQIPSVARDDDFALAIPIRRVGPDWTREPGGADPFLSALLQDARAGILAAQEEGFPLVASLRGQLRPLIADVAMQNYAAFGSAMPDPRAASLWFVWTDAHGGLRTGSADPVGSERWAASGHY